MTWKLLLVVTAQAMIRSLLQGRRLLILGHQLLGMDRVMGINHLVLGPHLRSAVHQLQETGRAHLVLLLLLAHLPLLVLPLLPVHLLLTHLRNLLYQHPHPIQHHLPRLLLLPLQIRLPLLTLLYLLLKVLLALVLILTLRNPLLYQLLVMLQVRQPLHLLQLW
jgi:hypothetical protein